MVSKYDVVECQKCKRQIPYMDNEIKNPDGMIIGFLCEKCAFSIFGVDEK